MLPRSWLAPCFLYKFKTRNETAVRLITWIFALCSFIISKLVYIKRTDIILLSSTRWEIRDHVIDTEQILPMQNTENDNSRIIIGVKYPQIGLEISLMFTTVFMWKYGQLIAWENIFSLDYQIYRMESTCSLRHLILEAYLTALTERHQELLQHEQHFLTTSANGSHVP